MRAQSVAPISMYLMDIIINHQRYTCVPIRQFRAEYHLPDDFGVALFEPKDFTGMASIDKAGDALKTLRQTVLDGLASPSPDLSDGEFWDAFTGLFYHTLKAVNDAIGLKDAEIDFALSGYADMLHTWFIDYFRARQTKTAPTPFDTLYDEWVANSGRRSERIHHYQHNGADWHIRILNNIYGRVGLQVDMPDKTVYVHDPIYQCPAEGFMRHLLQDVVKKLSA
ncbi:MAG: hypothetical protein CUN52_07090 [Phototrophicales bacterium]|nr:MAG: hypothetical protein CUN52_07090 [Phototrophicales bacterium]